MKLAADVLQKPQYKTSLERSDDAPDQICEVLRKWVIKFDLPIFAAAHALAPYNHSMMADLSRSRADHEFFSIIDRLLLVFTVLAMRSPIELGPEKGGMIGFSVPRSINESRVIAHKAVEEYRGQYLGKSGIWSEIQPCWEADLVNVVPSAFFLDLAPGGPLSVLRHFAAPIVAMIPSATEVERMHKINRDVITADRVQLSDRTRHQLLRATKVVTLALLR